VAAAAEVTAAAARAVLPAIAGSRASRAILHTEASVGFGGQELRILSEASWLRDNGWPVHLVAQPGSRLLAEARAAGLPAEAVRMRGAVDLVALGRLRRLLRERAIALVHTHSSVDGWLGGLAARTRRLPVVRSRHVSIPVLRRRALVYRLADRIIASGDTIAGVLRRAGVPAERIVPIPPGVDTTRFHPGVSGAGVRAELGLTGPAVGLVANIRGSKGHAHFLEAARLVLPESPAARFLIVGDGVGAETVRAQVGALGLEGQVIMTGFRRDVPEVMAALDALVLPSTRSEGSPQVIPQALAVGTPVIATRAGGSGDIVRDGETARLVPPADSRALADAILEVLRDPARVRAMARRGQQEVLAEHSLDATMARTVRVYESLLRPS
jgi:glycosyltransferase involved in cell wall biosynthesis